MEHFIFELLLIWTWRRRRRDGRIVEEEEEIFACPEFQTQKNFKAQVCSSKTKSVLELQMMIYFFTSLCE